MMRPHLPRRGLLVILGASIVSLILVRNVFIAERPRPDADEMAVAARLCERWFLSIRDLKEDRGLWAADREEPGFRWMLGQRFTAITTTLGSLEAKETASNPEFAALLVRLFHDGGVKPGDAVGITLSGSFPALGLATLAAAEVVGARPVLVSSLGSSSYGANEPGATWIDMEGWLRQEEGMLAESRFVTPGAEGDAGGGLPEGGLDSLHDAARRNGRELTIPMSLKEGIRLRTALFVAEEVKLLVNIGGGQTALGTCPHAPVLPTGYNTSLPHCPHPERGVVERVAERGVPVIHLLNVQDLATRYGLPMGRKTFNGERSRIFLDRYVMKIPVLVVVGLLILLLHVGKTRLWAGAGIARDLP